MTDDDFQSRFGILGELAKSDVAIEPFFEALIRSLAADFPQTLQFAAVWYRAPSPRSPIPLRPVCAFGAPSPSWDFERQLVVAELRSRGEVLNRDARQTVGDAVSGARTDV